MWEGKTVSVILPTYNEKDSIRKCVEDFFATGFVDEVVVVNNNAVPGTAEEVMNTKARQVFEETAGIWVMPFNAVLKSQRRYTGNL